jgi:hypothetical protein
MVLNVWLCGVESVLSLESELNMSGICVEP